MSSEPVPGSIPWFEREALRMDWKSLFVYDNKVVRLIGAPSQRAEYAGIMFAPGHVMLLHRETGIAVVETSEHSQQKCRQRAIERLTSLLEKHECGRWTIPTVLD